MKFEERSYAGEFFRPKPKVILSENPSSLLIITSWGERDESDHVIELFEEQLRSESGIESTTPFGQIESLGVKGNQLRTAAMLANDYLLKTANRTEYIAAAEFLGLVFEKGVLSWVQIGSPHMMISHHGKIQPLAFYLDQSWQHQQSSPLLSQALGLEAICQLNCESLHISEGAELFLISRDSLSTEIFQSPGMNLQKITQVLVQESSNKPFWAGHARL